jgi:Na+/H+-dicarboxylate symporter
MDGTALHEVAVAIYLPLILPVDWLPDRFRTAANTLGDSVGAAIVDQSFLE